METTGPSTDIKIIALIGAMKSGTTSLAKLLSVSPDLTLADRKEPGYFSRDERWRKGWSWYRTQFSGYQKGKLLLDASTCYSRSTRYPHAAQRLAIVNPDARVIYLLRHPVDRAISHYYHEMIRRFARGETLEPIHEFLSHDTECISTSFYDRELQIWRDYFPQNAIFLMRFEELVQAPIAVTNQLLRNLTLRQISDCDGVIHRGMSHANQSVDSALKICSGMIEEKLLTSIPGRLMRATLSPLRILNLREVLRNGAMRWGLSHRLYLKFLQQVDYPTDELVLWLHEILDPHTERLEGMTGWDLSSWYARHYSSYSYYLSDASDSSLSTYPSTTRNASL